MKLKYLDLFREKKNEINDKIFEIKQIIINFKELLNFYDVFIVVVYKLRNFEFRNLLKKVRIFLLDFVFYQIDKE